jgi:hypothetical protein
MSEELRIQAQIELRAPRCLREDEAAKFERDQNRHARRRNQRRAEQQRTVAGQNPQDPADHRRVDNGQLQTGAKREECRSEDRKHQNRPRDADAESDRTGEDAEELR